MRAIITGVIGAFRFVDIKGGNQVGQVDLIQAGNERHPTKVISLFIPSKAYCRVILEHMEGNREPMISLLVWIKDGKEIEIDVIEILSIAYPAEVRP